MTKGLEVTEKSVQYDGDRSVRHWPNADRQFLVEVLIVYVRDILARKRPAVISVKPSATIADLCRMLRENHVGAAVVSGDGQTIEGVITERDITYGLAVHNTALPALPVSELMTKTVITCSPDERVAIVASTMLSRKIRHIPVVDGKRPIGMVSIRDVLNVRVDELQQMTAQLRTFVTETERPPQDRD